MIIKVSQHLSHVLNYCEAAGFTVNWISPRMRTFSASYYLTCAARVHIFNYSCTLCCLSFWIMLYLWTRETWSFYCRAVRRKKVQCLFSVENHIFSQKIPVARTFLWKGGLLLMWQIMVVLSKCSRRPAFAYERYLLNWSCAANVFGQTGLWVPRHLISIVFEAFPNPKNDCGKLPCVFC